jgi:hypothetical protein
MGAPARCLTGKNHEVGCAAAPGLVSRLHIVAFCDEVDGRGEPRSGNASRNLSATLAPHHAPQRRVLEADVRRDELIDDFRVKAAAQEIREATADDRLVVLDCPHALACLRTSVTAVTTRLESDSL